MDIDVHIRRVERDLSSRPGVTYVESPNLKRVSPHANRAIIRARLHFFDDSFLDIKETVETYRCFPQYVKYSYQYMKNGEQVFRYDNTPHHPEVSTFPDHKHIGTDDDERIEDSEQPNLDTIFREINQYLIE